MEFSGPTVLWGGTAPFLSATVGTGHQMPHPPGIQEGLEQPRDEDGGTVRGKLLWPPKDTEHPAQDLDQLSIRVLLALEDSGPP